MKKIYLILMGVLLFVGKTVADVTNVYTQQFTATSNVFTMGVWTQTPTQGNQWSQIAGQTNTVGHGDGTSITVAAHETDALDLWAFSDNFELEAGKTYAIDFWVKIPSNVTGKPIPGSLEVKIGTTDSPAGMTVLLYNNQGKGVATNTTWQEATGYITPAATAYYHLGFHAYSAAGSNVGNINVDDIIVREVPNQAACGALPLFEDFEDIFCEGWKSINLGGQPSNDLVRFNATTGYPTTKSGNYVWRFMSYNSSSDGVYDQYLITPELPVTSNAKEVSFFLNVAGNLANGKIKIGYSTTTNQTGDFTGWQELTLPSVTYTWQEYAIAIPANAKYVALYSCPTTNGAYIYLDDLSIKELMPFDGGVTAITAPVSGAELTDGTVSVKVKNLGSNPLSGFNVVYKVDNGTPVSELFSGTLNAGEEQVFDFTTPFDISTFKTYHIEAYTDVTGDGNPANDAFIVDVENFGPCKITSFPWDEGFEAGLIPPNPCWKSYIEQSSGNRPWKIVDTSVRPSGITPHGGSKMIEFDSYNIPNGGKATLVTPIIQHTGHLKFSFWIYRSSSNADQQERVNIYISSTPVASGAPLKTVYRSISLAPVETGPDGWYQYNVIMPGASGDNFYVILEGISSWGNNNIYIDDLSVGDYADTSDAGVTEIIEPKSGKNLSATETVKVKIKNYGTLAIPAGMPVSFKINDGTPVTEATTEELPYDGEIIYTFTGKADLSATETTDFTIKAYTGLTGDANTSNDEATPKLVKNTYCDVIYDFPWTEGFEDDITDVPYLPTACWTATATGTFSSLPTAWRHQIGNGIAPSCSPKSGGAMLQFRSYNYNFGSKGVLYTPPMALSDKEVLLSFWMFRDSEMSQKDSVNVYVSETPDITGLTPLKTVYRNRGLIPVEAADGWYKYSIIVPATGFANTYFAIEGASAYGNNIYVDDLRVDVLPSYTTTPAKNAVDVITNTAVQLSFLETMTVTEDVMNKVSIKETGTDNAVNVTGVTNNSTGRVTIAHDLLLPEKNYTVTVLAGALNQYPGDISWSFTTRATT
ncbi:MAG: choice-of-anchor J domain-containing protein, partial [Dysgonamonadaceae bacterium]|nr:choice-of-anchor J domain-containing protein [Dysgonamonadaceae bacterium]